MKKTIKKPKPRRLHLAGKVKLTITMTQEAKDEAFAMAEERGTSLGALFAELIRLARPAPP